MSQDQVSDSVTQCARKLLWFFALSATAALLYKLVAAPNLTTVFGDMAGVIAIVLATHIVGLSLGANLDGELAGRVKSPLLDKRELNTTEIDAFIADTARRHDFTPEGLVSIDDTAYLEYSTPRGNILGYNSGKWMLRNIRKYRKAKGSLGNEGK